MPSSAVVIPASVAQLDASVGPSGETLSELVMTALQTLLHTLSSRVVAIYVEHQSSELAVARVSPTAAEVPTDGFSLELRFASWLNGLTTSEVRAVPTFLLAWLPVGKVVVVPLLVEGRHRGAIVVEAAKLDRSELGQIGGLAQQLTACLADLARNQPQGVESVRLQFAKSVRRIKTSTRP